MTQQFFAALHEAGVAGTAQRESFEKQFLVKKT
jgi:hypothetical protein